MILYDDRDPAGLGEFGIDIPVSDSRTALTFAHLADHPVLGKAVNRWHLSRITETIDREDLLRAHTRAYIDRLFGTALASEIIRTYELIDAEGCFHRYRPESAILPLERLFERILRKVAGTAQCCRTALESGFCFYLGGGMHHAQTDFGNGFCMLNDIVIGLRKLQAEARIRTAWVIDVDAHKGDGTAAMTQDDPTIKTLSIHMAAGWPLDGSPVLPDGRPNPSFVPSDIDIPIAAGEEAVYLDRLAEGLTRLASLGKPDIALVVSGADPYEKDALPSAQPLQMTRDQLLERDIGIYRFLTEQGVPYAGVMAGGYGDFAWEIYAAFLEQILLERLARAAAEVSSLRTERPEMS